MKKMLMSALLTAGLLTAVVPAAQAQAQAQTTRECTNAELVASYHATGAAMSHRFGRIVLMNASDHSCTIEGYGGLSYVGRGDGSQIGAPAQRDKSKVRSIEVRPGQKVVSRVSSAVAAVYPKGTCRPAHVNGFRVYLPDETHSQFVEHPTTGCRSHGVHLLSHQAYRRP